MPCRDRALPVVRRRRAGLYPKPDFAFFLTPFRAWELLLGALLGLRFFPATATSDLKSVIGGSGLALVLFAVFGFSRDTPLPLATATACVGTALIIDSSQTGDLGRGPPAVVAARGLHRADFLFALPLALADHGVPAF